MKLHTYTLILAAVLFSQLQCKTPQGQSSDNASTQNHDERQKIATIAKMAVTTQEQPQVFPPIFQYSNTASITATDLVSVPIINTSDFHGWLEPLIPKNRNLYYGGIANLAGFLKHKEKIDHDNTIFIDSGDMWTGPSISTLTKGKSTIEVYNILGIDAAIIGNHEFDYGIENLRMRAHEARFPFLAANIKSKDKDSQLDFAAPFRIFESNGIKVGVLGLGYKNTPFETHPKRVKSLEFLDYEPTIRMWVPKIRELGANVVIAVVHDTNPTVKKVAEALKDLNIPVFFGGQQHQYGYSFLKNSEPNKESIILNPGGFGRSYARVDLIFDRKSKTYLGFKAKIEMVTGRIDKPEYPADEQVAELVKKIVQSSDKEDELLGDIETPLAVGNFNNSPLGHWVVDSWLASVPKADFAICNFGAFRQPLPAGSILYKDILSVMPFENNLYIVTITGEHLIHELSKDEPVVGGLKYTYKLDEAGKRQIVQVFDNYGAEIDKTKKYSIIINDFMYSGGDGYLFYQQDPSPVDTGLGWRDPVIKVLKQLSNEGQKVSISSSESRGVLSEDS